MAGADVHEQVFGAAGAGETPDGVAAEVQPPGDLPDAVALLQQSVNDGMPFPGADGDPIVPVGGRPRWGGRLRRRSRCGLSGERGDQGRQVMAVPGKSAFDGLAEVPPQVSAICHLDRLRCAAGHALGIGAGPVPAHDLDAGVSL
ncbi:hypothetical protein Mame01_63530 [Microbispora amethystogenes]|nr:hypothetical protein Mame01_63530 [Microbispora amethystogenes]